MSTHMIRTQKSHLHNMPLNVSLFQCGMYLRQRRKNISQLQAQTRNLSGKLQAHIFVPKFLHTKERKLYLFLLTIKQRKLTSFRENSHSQSRLDTFIQIYEKFTCVLVATNFNSVKAVGIHRKYRVTQRVEDKCGCQSEELLLLRSTPS